MHKNIIQSKKYIHSQHILLLLLIAASAILHYFDLGSILRYDRDLILAGEWYRLISANFVHLNTTHLVLNMLGIALILIFFSTHLELYQWLILIIISSLFVSFNLLLFNTDVLYYVGMSGVLHSLFIVGAVIEIRLFPISGWLLSVVLTLKVAQEQLLNDSMLAADSMMGGYVLVDSHLYGAITGIFFVTLLINKRKTNEKQFLNLNPI